MYQLNKDLRHLIFSFLTKCQVCAAQYPKNCLRYNYFRITITKNPHIEHLRNKSHTKTYMLDHFKKSCFKCYIKNAKLANKMMNQNFVQKLELGVYD